MSRQSSPSGRHRRSANHRLRNRALTVGVTTAMITTGLLAAAPRARAALDPHCEQQPNGQIVCAFQNPTESPYAFTTPAGFDAAEVSMQGGSGGSGNSNSPGGAGGSTNGTLAFSNSNGTNLDIYLGQPGQDSTCAGQSGGDGGNSDHNTGHVHGGGGGSAEDGQCGGGGGGGSFIMASGDDPTTTDPQAAAGGGGGGGGVTALLGGDGGTPDGSPGQGASHGDGGTQLDGGAGGAGNTHSSTQGQKGSRGNGGNGGNEDSSGPGCSPQPGCLNGAGGGGGGYFGGGGGGLGSGGGGGSGCLPCSGESGYTSTSVPGAPGADAPGPTFHPASVGSIIFTFGNIIAPNGNPGQQGPPGGPGGPGGPNDRGGHHNGNDPNPNTNPQRSMQPTTTTTCNPRIGFCRIGPIVGPDSVFNVSASGGTNRAELFGTLQAGLRPDCPNYSEMNGDWLAFGFQDPLAGSTWRKVTTLTTRHKLSRTDATALSRKMQICFEAPYRFATRNGYQLGGHNGLYDGVLPDCAALGATERGVKRPCVASRQVLQRKGGWVVRFAFRVPASDKDPKALG